MNGSGRGHAPPRPPAWGRISGLAKDPAMTRYRRSEGVYLASAHAISGRGATACVVSDWLGDAR